MTRSLAVLEAALILLLASCASVPAQTKAPDWILNTPKPDATMTYFVGYASDPNGDAAQATSSAASNLLADIMKYIGVKVSVSSSATARATLDSYSADVRSTVTSQSTNRISGFSIKDKYVAADKKSKQIIVYVLAAYATADLQAEKQRIAALFQEKEDAVARPEADGRDLASQGRYYDAVQKFIEAAVAASGSDIDNADIKMERNVNNARNALSKLRFDKLGVDSYAALVGQPFPQPFKLRLVSGEDAAAPGVPGAGLLVSYQRKQGTRLVSKTENAVTDGSGLVSYTPPPPDFVGKAKLLVRLDFQSSIELLDNLPDRFDSYRASLVDELKNKYVEIGYEVSSNAESIATAVAVLDLDESGNPVAGSQAQAGLLDVLTKAKFNVRALALDPGLLVRMDDDAILAAAKAAAVGDAQRFAYGVARIDSVAKDSSIFLATAKATVKVVEIATGRILFSAEKVATGLGPDEQSARRAAYREIGANAVGKELLSSLP